MKNEMIIEVSFSPTCLSFLSEIIRSFQTKADYFIVHDTLHEMMEWPYSGKDAGLLTSNVNPGEVYSHRHIYLKSIWSWDGPCTSTMRGRILFLGLQPLSQMRAGQPPRLLFSCPPCVSST